MNSKKCRFHFVTFLVIFILSNSIFIIESSALTYSHPSTTPLWSYSTKKQYVSAVAISSDGTYITATSEDLVHEITIKANGKFYLFNNSISKDKSPLWNYSIINDFSSLAISGNGSSIIAGGGYFEKAVYLFNNSNPLPQWTYYTGGWVYDIDISDDGYIAAAASGISGCYLFCLNNSESFYISRYYTKGLALRVVLSSNGSFMAVTDNAAKLYFFNTSNVSPAWTYTLPGDMSTALSISADGNYIASGGDDVYVFNKSSPNPIWIYNTSTTVRSIKISRDGNYIVAGCWDKRIYLFNRNNSIPEWTYSTREEVNSVAISSNGDNIVALSNNYWLYLFNKSSSNPVWRYRLDGYPTANYDYSLGISSDGKYIVAGGRHRIYFFDRDIIVAPRLIIPGYNLFFMFLIIGIILLGNIIAIFLKHKNNKKHFLINLKNKL